MVSDSCLRHHHFFWRWIENYLFVTTHHSSVEHKLGKQCQVQVKRTKEEKKVVPKETWLTYKSKHGSTDKQQSPDTERASDMAHAIWGSNHEETLENTLHSLVFCSLYLHSQENTVFRQPNSSTSYNNNQKKGKPARKKASAKKCFCIVYTLFRFFVCSLKSPRINVDVIHRLNNIALPHFISDLHFCCCFPVLLCGTIFILLRQSACCWSVFLCFLVFSPQLALWLPFWPLHSLQWLNPRVTTRSMDETWWKTWVTRFMAVRAAANKSIVLDLRGKRKNFLYFFSKMQGIKMYQEMKKDVLCL